MTDRAKQRPAPATLSDRARAQLAATVAALRRPESYPPPVAQVESIETHMSWVFLIGPHAYKLKKPIRTAVLDHETSEARRRACEAELELNRRLAPAVYLDVVPVTATGDRLCVAGDGQPVDWLVKMRRLPRDRMLDVCIERRVLRRHEVDELADTLIRFYTTTQRAAESGPAYRDRIACDIDAKAASLARPQYRLSRAEIDDVVTGQRHWLARHGALLEGRGAAVVDAHGDLRPEHVCLEARPVVIDCLEFDRELRLLDPVSELSFLALECDRLGARWVGAQLLAGYAARTGDQVPGALLSFYRSHHALVRAAVAVWHLDDDALDHSEVWRQRAGHYLRLARELP
jgi:aminoglycoside phosphotransferase family enzyme